MHLPDLEQKYLHHLAAEGCSPKTLKTYRSTFRSTWRVTAELGGELQTATLDRAWARMLVEWWRDEEGLSPATIHRNVGALRGMFKFAIVRDLVEMDPFAYVELPRKQRVERVELGQEELNALVEAAASVGDRRRTTMLQAMLLTQIAIGSRVDELLSLRVDDLNLEQKVVRIRRGKGGKTREVPIGSRTEAALRAWVHLRADWLATRAGDGRVRGEEPTALWLADRGRRMSTAALARVLDDLCRHAGLSVKVRIHDLRGITSRRWRREGVPLETISAWLGHADLATTRVYVRDACADARPWAHLCDLPEPEETPASLDVARPEASSPTSIEQPAYPPSDACVRLPLAEMTASALTAVSPLEVLRVLQALQSAPLLLQLLGMAAPTACATIVPANSR